MCELPGFNTWCQLLESRSLRRSSSLPEPHFLEHGSHGALCGTVWGRASYLGCVWQVVTVTVVTGTCRLPASLTLSGLCLSAASPLRLPLNFPPRSLPCLSAVLVVSGHRLVSFHSPRLTLESVLHSVMGSMPLFPALRRLGRGD